MSEAAAPARRASSLRGNPHPLGATCVPGGVNFSVFSREATRLDLLLFEGGGPQGPARVVPMDPVANRTYHYWHVFVAGAKPGQIYAFRADGPSDPASGCRFDYSKTLLDPYGRAVFTPKG